MSMSVCENVKMSYKFMGRKSPIAKVKRSLFGKVDPEDNKAFIQNHLNYDMSKNCAKWNFNFREETTLDPEGDIIWRSASPVIVNRKRKIVEIVEAPAYYFQPIEPAARSTESPKIKVPKQTQITDYMVKSKRQVVCKKDTAVERPIKIPKLDFCSS
ncbi:uncharacterized protein LOC661675 [Tribolium castaneum]|uniref:Cyclin-dependent kinase inhibitor domain-containing protein n=1 Tax=Tribolium castaneum TaxID=7070 RepID=D1ZZI2_TRICA|nr:PREDICTED: uncharacterized protein LOC661675 [Tribolium castaneum]EFA02374.1 hypothetical protein TcasGA2_TC008049 [Tribolium castaneum]|eukprot:XP_976393.1 PREDICTED: uncharacterized protein LOC661675 [Tribolium castaneum]